VDGLADELLDQAEQGITPIVLEASTSEVPPERSDDEVDDSVDRINALTTSPLLVEVDGTTEEFQPPEVRSWLTIEVGPPGTEILVSIDQIAPQMAIEERFADAGEPGAPANIDIIDGKPIATGGSTGTRCCAPGAADEIFAALETVVGQGDVGFSGSRRCWHDFAEGRHDLGVGGLELEVDLALAEVTSEPTPEAFEESTFTADGHGPAHCRVDIDFQACLSCIGRDHTGGGHDFHGGLAEGRGNRSHLDIELLLRQPTNVLAGDGDVAIDLIVVNGRV
jgi:hypothetical protein